MSNEASPTKVVLKNVRFSYASVFEPKTVGKGTDKKYSVSLLIPKTDKVSKAAIDAAIEHLVADAKSKNKNKLPSGFKLPLRDGDVDRDDDSNYEGHWFINASSKTKPGIVDRNKVEITDPSKFYSGCYGFASVNFYLFDVDTNKGIACGLNNLMKTKDGDPLAGKASAEADFADVEFEDEDEDLL